MTDLSALIVRMATENPGWGYPRIQGALKHLGPGVARSTVAKVLKANGIPPAPDRPSSWRTFLRAPWGAIGGADCFPSAVWTPRGLVTDYTLFVLDLRSRRVPVAGSVAGAPPGPPRRPGRPGDGGIPPDRRRRGGADRADARPGAECQCLRGALRALDPGGVSRPPHLVRRAAPSSERSTSSWRTTTGSGTIRGSATS